MARVRAVIFDFNGIIVDDEPIHFQLFQKVLGEEGMFLPDTLNQLPLAKLKQRGLKIPITDIYNPNGPSIKDAVVRVGFGAGYGTGEFISPEGLVLTNHHVAFDGLVGASDATKDYGTMGYLARNRSEELPLSGYTITMTQDLRDVILVGHLRPGRVGGPTGGD